MLHTDKQTNKQMHSNIPTMPPDSDSVSNEHLGITILKPGFHYPS